MLLWLSDYEWSCSSVVRAVLISAYQFILALLAKPRDILFCISVAEYCVFTLLSFSTVSLVSGSGDYVHVFEKATTLLQTGLLLPLPPGRLPFLADLGLFFVLRGSQFNLKEVYLAYQGRREVK